jgi:hypothetical protein
MEHDYRAVIVLLVRGSRTERRMANKEQGDDNNRVAGEIKQSAREFAEATSEVVANRKNMAADYIEAVAGAVDCGARDLQQKGRTETASLARSASEQLGAFARRMTDRQPREVLEDIQEFARRQPTLCFGIAALAGFGLMRFLKSSADRRAAGSHDGAPSTSKTWSH